MSWQDGIVGFGERIGRSMGNTDVKVTWATHSVWVETAIALGRRRLQAEPGVVLKGVESICPSR